MVLNRGNLDEVREVAVRWHHAMVPFVYVNTDEVWAQTRCKKCGVAVRIRQSGLIDAPKKFYEECVPIEKRGRGRPYRGQPSVSQPEYQSARRAARMLSEGKGHDVTNFQHVGRGYLYAMAECRKCGEKLEIHADKSIHGKCKTRWCTG